MMAFNPTPTVAVARDFAKTYSKKQVIILHLDDEHLGYASYGTTRALCDDAAELADVAYKAILAHPRGK